MENLSPMMQQYMNIKNENADSILFFRLGDFYEMFFSDAELVSDELGLTLTRKSCGKESKKAPMCGIPYHSCESYIARLVSKGYKIAMCDQIGNPSDSKGLVKREVVRIITPGTVMEESMLDESKNNYICSVYCSSLLPIAGICFCDVSTGELKVTEILGNDNELINQIKIEIGKFSPKEVLCILKEPLVDPISFFIKDKLECNLEVFQDCISDEECSNIVSGHFKAAIKDLQLQDKISPVKSLAHLIKYLKSTQKGSLSHICLPVFYDKSQYMGLDLNTIRNLELLETIRTKSRKGSLLWVMDKTTTAMGKRLLRSWIERPLLDTNKILLRQGAVNEFFERSVYREDLKKELRKIRDIQRLITKISYASANARDLRGFALAISSFPNIKELLKKAESKMLKKMYFKFDTIQDVHDLIMSAIREDEENHRLPTTIKEGNIIKAGYDEEVDRLRKDQQCGTEEIAKIQSRERTNTGISKLKIAHNNAFGYFIEVTNSFKHLVPDHYIRKQTLTGCERYVTEELKEIEERVLRANEKINEVEYKVFESVRNSVSANFNRIIEVSKIIAALDVIISLSEVAVQNNYVRPIVNTLENINIIQGRHPVVESLIKDVSFVPNDLILDNKQNAVAIITGPNMAGKSTYMRQSAIIVLLAQIGSFVPATRASIGIVDNIFTRIGASDDLTAGQSTFMVEMSEVADIIKNSTSKSLLILDEIGRGTSTFDGMSIARAVLEYVADKSKLGAKTLFATHYHELTDVSQEFPNIQNYSVDVRRQRDNITFLHQIIPGAVDDSYGIEVAKLAGLPNSVISRAREILNEIESSEKNKSKENTTKVPSMSVCLKDFDTSTYEEILGELKSINMGVLTPIQAMNILYKLVSLAKNF